MMTKIKFNARRASGSAMLLVAVWVAVWVTAGLPSMGLRPAAAQDRSGLDTSTPTWLRERFSDRIYHRRDNTDMIQLVRPVAQSVAGSVVGVICGGRPVAMGTVVSDQGISDQGITAAGSEPMRNAYVITKRSELTNDPIQVRLADGRMLPARVAAVRRRSDLALLVLQSSAAVAARSLRPVEFRSIVPAVGAFLISPDRDARMIGLGVVGTGPIAVAHRGILGVRLVREAAPGARVELILPDSGADEAGLELGDRIIAIDGEMQPDSNSVQSTLKARFPGEVVRLTIQRGGDTVDISAKLRDESIMNESENDARVNGPRNTRLSGFDRVIQHDTVLNPDQCGGPLMDIDGNVIGINIARAGRVVSYALPSSLVASEVTGMIVESRGK